MEKQFIFNSSMPRSGSELLQCILHQNDNIYASSTSPVLEYWFGARGNQNLPEVRSQPQELMKDKKLKKEPRGSRPAAGSRHSTQGTCPRPEQLPGISSIFSSQPR